MADKWKFVVASGFGGSRQRQSTCAAIKRVVQQRGLELVLPMVKYEVSRGWEYYLGVAVDMRHYDDGACPELEARDLLRQVGVTGTVFEDLFDAESVARLLRGTAEYDRFTEAMQYEEPPAKLTCTAEELYALADEAEPPDVDLLRARAFDRLLYWCSAVGAGSLERLGDACSALSLSDEWGGTWSVLRRLALLGHVEFDGARNLRWGTVPPTLVSMATDPDEQILVGQRSPALIRSLRDRYTVIEEAQPGAPARVLVYGADGTPDLNGRPACLGCVSRQLAERLPALEDWVARLPEWQEVDFDRYSIERYEPVANLCFPHNAVGDLCDGLYRFEIEQHGRRIRTTAYRDDVAGRWLCGDFYGLRFLARARAGLAQPPVLTEAGRLALPAADHWPLPYERALVLAGGLLPTAARTELGEPALIYSGISASLAEQLCGRLGLTHE